MQAARKERLLSKAIIPCGIWYYWAGHVYDSGTCKFFFGITRSHLREKDGVRRHGSALKLPIRKVCRECSTRRRRRTIKLQLRANPMSNHLPRQTVLRWLLTGTGPLASPGVENGAFLATSANKAAPDVQVRLSCVMSGERCGACLQAESTPRPYCS